MSLTETAKTPEMTIETIEKLIGLGVIGGMITKSQLKELQAKLKVLVEGLQQEQVEYKN